MRHNSQFPLRSSTEEYAFASGRVTPCSSEIFPCYQADHNRIDRSEAQGRSWLQRQSSFNVRESQKGLQFVGHCSQKLKRNTLPAYLQPSQSTPYFQSFSPTVFSSQIQRKIRFTYHSPMNQSLSSLTFPHFGLDPRRHLQERINVFQFPKKQAKRAKNKLSSCEFSFFYAPQKFDKIENSNQSPEKLCKSIPFYDCTKTSIMSGCKDSDRCPNEGNSSKMASTISTQSFNDNRRSDFSSNDFKAITFDSKVSFFGNSKEDLSARIPMAKQLGKTVIIPNDYNFGGIIQQDSVEHSPLLGKKQSNKNGLAGNEIELRQWNNHVRCLLQDTQSNDQNLKESIHCGPEIRLQRHKFQLLGQFGREIKESSMSFQQ